MQIKIAIVALSVCMYFITGCDNTATKEHATPQKDTSTKKIAEEHAAFDLDTAHKTENMNSDNGLMNNSMDKMSAMSMTGDFDLDFANMMIAHHQGAVDMSKTEVASGTDNLLKTMANSIISSQTKEIGRLKQIVSAYKPSGMKHGEGELAKTMVDMKGKMSAPMSGNTDKDYAMMMIAHHEGAIAMSKGQVKNGMNEELKRFAKKAIADQSKEITKFKNWLAANK